jgi:molybdenum cofactor cytidylyltransferase
MKIRAALNHESGLLSDLATRAKAHWGYSEEMLERWKAELTVSASDIAAHLTFVATIEEIVAGFYSLLPSAGPWTLNHFWVSPQYMHRGIGRSLLTHALDTAVGRGASVVKVDADPNAEGFYVQCGALRLGEVSAPIPGQPKRVRPQLAFHADAI